MPRQFPDFGPVSNAIQDVGNFGLQASALGFGKPKTDPVDDREIRTDANGIIWQWDAAGNAWRFLGNSLQRHLGAPAMDFFYYGGGVSFNAGTLTIGAVQGYHSWPEADESLLKLPSRFSAPQMTKTFNPSAAWASGANGNSYFDYGGITLAGSTTDRLLVVMMIRRESDGAVDYFISQLDDALAIFSYILPIVNGPLTINGVKWRTCGIIGQLIWDQARGRIINCGQQGKTTYLDEEKVQTLALTSALTANYTKAPYARCDFSIYCGPRVGGAANAVRVTNSTSAATGALHIGFNTMLTSNQGVNFNYTSPVGINGNQPFAVSGNVTTFEVRLISWTQESLAKIGF